MTTMATLLDQAQRVLHDAATIGQDGQIWTRAELLDWANEGYRRLLATGTGVRRFTVLETPPRWAYTLTQPWESRFSDRGTHVQWSHQTVGGYSASAIFEVEQLEGLTPSAAASGISQSWERAYLAADHTPFRFALPRDNSRVVKLWHDHQLLHPLATRELDDMETGWISLSGEPLCWVPGTGRNRTVEVFAVETAYQQSYHQYLNPHGIPRRWTGSRTYSAASTASTAWAYTTTGDAEALTGRGQPFAPHWAYAFGWETAHLPTGAAALNWTVNAMPHDPALATVCTQPWEYAAVSGGPALAGSTTGGARVMFAWERRDPSGNYGPFQAPRSDVRPRVGPGLGARATQDAVSSVHGLYGWEVQHLNGTTPTAGTTLVATYSWEEPYGAAALPLAVGLARGLSSPDRQYLAREEPHVNTPLGRPMQFLSSDDNLLLLEQISNELAPLLATDTPVLLPPQLHKYVRFWVLHRAFDRAGEGRQPALAALYLTRFQRAERFLQQLGQLTRADVHAARTSRPLGGRPPRPRLPASFPSVRG